MKNRLFLFIGVVFCTITSAVEPEEPIVILKDEVFSLTQTIPTTTVKNQYRSSTCWSFATISFVETELLRTQNVSYDLSEMFIVRNVYTEKANKYVRMHGTINFAGGGEANDVINVIKNDGIVTEEAYTGLLVDTAYHIHTELDEVLKNYVESIVKNPNKKLTNVWENGFSGLLDSYLGEVPNEFFYNGEKYNSKSFAASLSFNPDDYIMLSSFTHHPFYKPFAMEVPDNWSWGEVYNLPLEDFEEVTKHALNNGYSVVWAADYSEKGFMHNKGLAVAPRALYSPVTKEERKMSKLSISEYRNLFNVLEMDVEEIEVTQELRQEAFDNYSTTDDHGMHIVGLAKDKNGKSYYYVKNSWGTENPYSGYLFVSEAYFNYKTISIMLHKAALPQKIKAELGL